MNFVFLSQNYFGPCYTTVADMPMLVVQRVCIINKRHFLVLSSSPYCYYYLFLSLAHRSENPLWFVLVQFLEGAGNRQSLRVKSWRYALLNFISNGTIELPSLLIVRYVISESGSVFYPFVQFLH